MTLTANLDLDVLITEHANTYRSLSTGNTEIGSSVSTLGEFCAFIRRAHNDYGGTYTVTADGDIVELTHRTHLDIVRHVYLLVSDDQDAIRVALEATVAELSG